jgi:periplasmic protein TonB
MFAESMLESNGLPPTRRGLTTLASFAIQVIALAAFVAVPVLFPEALRLQARVPIPPTIFTPAVPEDHVERSTSQTGSGPVISGHPIAFLQPGRIPSGTRDPGLTDPPLCMTGCGGGNGVPGSIDLNGLGPVVPTTRVVRAKPPIISSMQVGTPIIRVQPVYPALAKPIRVQGDVVLTAIISKEGAIDSLRVLSGHPMLVPAAVDAVKQWRYRPYVLNGERIEVETRITVSFRLGQ